MLAQRVQRLVEANEVAGNELGALVDELVEGVLAVGAGFAPDDGAGLVVGDVAVEGDVLAVRLHGELLEIGREALEVLVVGQDGDGLGVKEIVVPDSEHAHEDRQVFLEGSCPEVLVHFVEAGEQVAGTFRGRWRPWWRGRWPNPWSSGRRPNPEKPNMLAVSMPNSETFSALVETATKCLAMAECSLSLARDQTRAEWALVMVSRVVKVLEEMMKSVSSGRGRGWPRRNRCHLRLRRSGRSGRGRSNGEVLHRP